MNIFFGKTTESKGPRPQEARPASLPLYLAGAAAQIAGLSAVAYQVAEPAFAYFTILLTIIGASTAFFLRKQGASPRFMQFGIVLVGLVFLYAIRGSGLFALIMPQEARAMQEVLLVSALAFTATFCTFLWLNDEAVVFSCVWSIAMIGLTGTININRELIISFVVFLAAATFLLVHQNSLAQSNGNAAVTLEDDPERTASWRLLRTQAIMAVIAWGGSILLGFLIAIPVQMVGRNLSLNSIIQRLKVAPTPIRRPSVRPRLIFDSLNDFRVGLGPVDDDPSERMSVLTEGPHYWRARTFDQYTGKGWISTLPSGGEDIFPDEGQPEREEFSTFNLPELLKPRRKARTVTHRFHLNGGIFGPLYHAAEPRRIRAPLYRIILREDNTLNAGRGLGSDYEVDSEIAEPTPADLQKSRTDYPTEITERFLDRGAPNQELQALAAEATRGAGANPYDRALAIQRFISSRCLYTREARAVPREKDAAAFFLNDSREGYCDLYATSMAILCRYAGIPARIATGFAPGRVATADSNVSPVAKGDTRQWYVLRGSDLHAWAEVYFVDYGWIPFDATIDTAGINAPEQTPEPVKKKETIKTLWGLSGLSYLLIGVGVLGILYAVVNELLGRFAPRFAFAGRRTHRPTNEVVALYLRTVRQIARKGARRADSMTPSEYLRYLRTDFDAGVAEAMQPLTVLTERALYGPESLSEEERSGARAAGQAVGAALKNYRKPAGKGPETKERKNGA
ncbi:MAG: transglutaminase domain-containing protein [Capsulimonadales bacterium]|nr:transglutaminase domain-containing protein [Capsulimonadales bacterium]